jgi:hypothetical protein
MESYKNILNTSPGFFQHMSHLSNEFEKPKLMFKNNLRIKYKTMRKIFSKKKS